MIKLKKYLSIGLALSFLIAYEGFSQEKGKFKNNPKIKQNTPEKKTTPPKSKEPDEEFQIETSNITFQNQFEPVKPLNPVASEDTSTIDEGEPVLLQEVDSLKIGDDMVKVAEYFAIWDTKSINPYGLSPLEFDESIELKLYDPTLNRFWNNPLETIKVTSQFGPRWGRMHSGTDLDLETGDPVYSVFDGEVRVAGWDGRGYGHFIVVRHQNGLETLYGHLSKILTESGQRIKAGELLGLGGSTGRSTGSHLHFENRYEGNPFDPRHLFDWENAQLRSDRFLLTKDVWNYLRGGKSYKNEIESSVEVATHNKYVLHKVRSGETLSSIASKYGTSISAIAKKNRISSGSKLRIGQKLRVK